MDALYYWLVISWLSNGLSVPFAGIFFCASEHLYHGASEPRVKEFRTNGTTVPLMLLPRWRVWIPGPTKTPERQGRQDTRIRPLLVINTQPGDLGEVVLHRREFLVGFVWPLQTRNWRAGWSESLRVPGEVRYLSSSASCTPENRMKAWQRALLPLRPPDTLQLGHKMECEKERWNSV